MSIEQKVKQWTTENADRLVELVSKLVEFDTVNHITDGNEASCQQYIKQIFEELGAEVDFYSPEEAPGFREHEAYFPGKDYTNRPNVSGIWRGSGSGEGKSLMFSSHIDTAVVAPGWEGREWTPRIDGDRLYGLGSFDMKGGLAASIIAVQCLQELGIALKGDVMIESVVDEEFGGANGTLAGRLRTEAADAAIIPEPTNLIVCPATRGGALWRVTFKGTTGLSFSGEKMVNPAHQAGKFIAFLDQFEDDRKKKSGPKPWYDGPSDLPVIVTRLEAGDLQSPLCDAGPTECTVDFWIECHPGVSEEELQREVIEQFGNMYGREVIEGPYAPTFEKMIRFLPGSEVSSDFPMIELLTSTIHSVTGERNEPSGAPFACDAFMFNLYSKTPALVLGPKGANAHAPDEYVEISSLIDLVQIYANTIVKWCEIE